MLVAVVAVAMLVLKVVGDVPGFIALCVVVALPIALAAVIAARAWKGRNGFDGNERAASGGERVGAYLIDVALPLFLVVGAEFFAFYVAVLATGRDLSLTINSWYLPALIGVWVVDSVVLQTLTGQTIGKQLVGLRTVSPVGGHPPLWSTVVRTVPIFPAFGPLGGFVELAFLAKSGQRLGDQLGRTKVVAR